MVSECRLALLVLWYICHAVGSGVVASHASSVKKMLDPVKSGVMLLTHPMSGGEHASNQQHNA